MVVSNLSLTELPDGEALVQTPQAERTLIVNAVGDAVLDLCDGTRTIAEIAAILRAAMNVPANVEVEADVERLVGQLLDAGVIGVSEA